MELVKRVDRNPVGRDFAVGDIHGHFSALRRVLDQARFDPARDRLFSVGDLVDRGPESEPCLEWLAQPWFYAVRGNHEDYAIRFVRTGEVDVATYRINGGSWFLDLSPERQAQYAAAFAQLPIAIEVPVERGLVGIVHADCPVPSWNDLANVLARRSKRDYCMWSRRRVAEWNETGVADIVAVVVGHTTVEEPITLGNVHHIDTGGWRSTGRFTLLRLDTL